jgi:hypothetical protein
MHNYIILTNSELDQVSDEEFNQLPYSNKSAVRHSLDNTKVCIQLSDPAPSFAAGKTTYTYEEIFAIMETSEWCVPLNPDDYTVFDDESIYT